MSVKILDIINKWDRVIVMAGIALSLVIFLVSSNRSSGRQEQSLTDIRTKQGEQDKSLNEFKAETKANQGAQDVVNKNVTDAITNIVNTNAKTVAILHALSVDHAKLMKIHNLYPESPVDFNREKSKPIEKNIQQTYNGKMQPFPQ